MVLSIKETNKSTYSKMSSCNICKGMKDFKFKNQKELLCGHKFHIRCLTPWLIKNKSCPTCKIPVNQEELQHQQDSCSICLDTGHTGYVKRQTKLSCGHKFHLVCLNSWLKVANTCPMCRKQVRQFKRQQAQEVWQDRHQAREVLQDWHQVQEVLQDWHQVQEVLQDQHQAQEVLQDRNQGMDMERLRQQEPHRGLQQQQLQNEIRQQHPERQGHQQELEVEIQQQQLQELARQFQSQEMLHAEEHHRYQLNLWGLMRTIPERIFRLFQG